MPCCGTFWLRQAEAAFYPHIRVSETYAASDNPVQAFMMTLNQRALTFGPTTDFNDPSLRACRCPTRSWTQVQCVSVP